MPACVELDANNHLVATTTPPESCTAYIIQTQTEWVNQQPPLLNLTVDQGADIGMHMLIVLAIAWGFRMLSRALDYEKGDSNESSG